MRCRGQEGAGEGLTPDCPHCSFQRFKIKNSEINSCKNKDLEADLAEDLGELDVGHEGLGEGGALGLGQGDEGEEEHEGDELGHSHRGGEKNERVTKGSRRILFGFCPLPSIGPFPHILFHFYRKGGSKIEERKRVAKLKSSSNNGV